QHHRCLGRTIAAPPEPRRLPNGEMHLSGFHTTHLRYGALQLSFERTTVIHSLGEVRHTPRRLVEKLESRPSGGWHAVLGQSDTRTGELAGRHHYPGPAALQAKLNLLCT